MELSETIVAALLGLVGTLIAAGLAYNQWRRQHQGEPTRKVNDSKRLALEGFWNELELIDIELRATVRTNTRPLSLDELLPRINTKFRANSFYLEESLQAIANEYVVKLHSAASLYIIAKHERGASPNWNYERSAPLSIQPGGETESEVVRRLLEIDELRKQLKKQIVNASRAG